MRAMVMVVVRSISHSFFFSQIFFFFPFFTFFLTCIGVDVNYKNYSAWQQPAKVGPALKICTTPNIPPRYIMYNVCHEIVAPSASFSHAHPKLPSSPNACQCRHFSAVEAGLNYSLGRPVSKTTQ